MRQFVLYSMDKSLSYDLTNGNIIAAEPSGLGNNFSVSYRENNKRKDVSNVKPDFDPIKLKLYFNADATVGYGNYKDLMLFLAKIGTDEFLFEYFDGITRKLCEVILKTAPKSEPQESGEFSETFIFERSYYWYEEIGQSFIFINSTTGGKFPLKFPFPFKGTRFVNKFTIVNDFFEPAPIIITIKGNIAKNIYIYIKSVATGKIVGETQLKTNSTAGTVIVINAATNKITVDNGTTVSNGYGLTDKSKQSFLELPKGEYEIGSNLAESDTGEISLSIRRYLYD